VGTDGAASNNNLDLLAEARLASLLAKGAVPSVAVTGSAGGPAREDVADTAARPTTLYEGPRSRAANAVPARTALELATRRAAATLKQADIGTLAPGLRADIAVVDLSAAHLTPRFRHAEALYSHLVYAAEAGDVRDTIVEGRVLMRQRQLLTLDEPRIRSKAQAWADASYPK